MPYDKTIVCLANSRKHSGRCIAGKLYEDGKFGEWVRPVSEHEYEQISEDDRRYQDGACAGILEIIEIPMKKPTPSHYQTENHLINNEYYWAQEGSVGWDELSKATDNPENLWTNGYHSIHGVNDRVPLHLANGYSNSLFFIKPENLRVSVSYEGGSKKKVRAYFTYSNEEYGLIVTDPVIERLMLRKEEGMYEYSDAYVCISMGEPFNDFAYKLVASIITEER